MSASGRPVHRTAPSPSGRFGQIAVQASKVLGAGRVVAAGRNAAVLDLLGHRGADEVVRLDGDYQAALREASQGGFDLMGTKAVRRTVVATVPTIRPGGRLVNVGMRAGRNVEGPEPSSRDATRSPTPPTCPQQVAEAWKRQGTSPDTKPVLVP